MFSALGSFFLSRRRETENADARLDIRRHDPDQQKNDQKKQPDETSDMWGQDDTIVSVEALSLFLVNFLQSLEPTAAKQEQNPQTAPARTSSSTVPATQAAKAYTAAAETYADEPGTLVIGQSMSAGAVSTLSAEEIRNIHKLIEDLKILASRNVHFLKIEPGTDFLQSLVQAVRKAGEKPQG